MAASESFFGGDKSKRVLENAARMRSGKDEMDNFLKRDFDRLPPEEQQSRLEQEENELRAEIASLRAEADDSESRFKDIARGRAETKLNRDLRGVK
jgi:hypothetical protein